MQPQVTSNRSCVISLSGSLVTCKLNVCLYSLASSQTHTQQGLSPLCQPVFKWRQYFSPALASGFFLGTGTCVCWTTVQLSPVTQLCPILCDSMDCSTPGFHVNHQLLELAQTHVHRVGDAIQPSHPLSSPSPPAFNISQHQGLFQWVSSSQVAKVLEFQLQHQSFQWTFRTDFL